MLSDQTVQQVHDLASLLDLLREELGWPLPIEATLEDVTFDWTASELRLQEAHAARLHGGVVQQLRPLAPGQPWGVFLVEFSDGQVYRTALRQVLRGLVPHRRRDPTLPAWQHENLLFLCTTRDYDRFTFAHFRGQDPRRAVLARFGWERGDTHLRTLCEYNLPALRFPDDGGTDPKAWLEQWRSAFDVERVTRAFFAEYRQVFEQMERAVRGVPEGEARRLYTQRLLNRLMFLYFIQKKGWLSFQGDRNYLRALFQAAQAAGEDFLNDRLYWTFFHGLNTLGEDETLHRLEELRERRGDVPFLNGGLFDLEDDYDVRGAVHIPNEVFHLLLNLFERYNFTVTESTPLDIEVAEVGPVHPLPGTRLPTAAVGRTPGVHHLRRLQRRQIRPPIARVLPEERPD